MLRAIALLVVLVLLAVTLAAGALGWRTWPAAFSLAALVIGLLVERYVYQPLRTERPGAGWERTAERFVDPSTGQPVSVYHNTHTGERRYVADDGRASDG